MVTPLSYTYDAASNLLTMKSSNSGGASDTYTYDQLNRLSTATDTSGATTYAYDAVGNLQNFTYPNGVTHAYSYDTLNRLTQVGAAKNSNSISNYAYTLGLAGNRLTVAELSGRTVNYGYDSLYRLTSETVASDPNNHDGTTSYIYDAVGNRKQLLVNGTTANSYTYDADDRLGSDQYDPDGNTTNSGGTANTYDFENHMTQYGLVTLVYDGDGNRVSETVGGVTTNYLVDTQNPTGYAQVIDELQSGTVARTYSLGLERISETQTLNSLLTTSFYGYDGHGSVRQLTNSSGAVRDSYDYDAFGNIVNQTGSTPNNYLFAGEQFDPAIDLYYNRARYLNTTTGRFWSMDTEEGQDEQPLTLHKYLYADADPVDGADPSGNQDNLAEVGAEESMGIALDAMAVPNFSTFANRAEVDIHFDLLSSVFRYYHAYLVVSGPGGPPTVFRGGPSTGCGASGASKEASGSAGANGDVGCGYLTDRGSGDPYAPGYADYPNKPTDNVASATVGNISQPYTQVVASFTKSAQTIEDSHLYYQPISQNSNSFAHTLIVKANLISPTPPVWVPGWDNILY